MRILTALNVLVLALACLVSSLEAQSPLPKAFEHSYQEIQEAFKSRSKVDESLGREDLLQETIYRYDEKGTLTRSVRLIWNVRQKVLSEVGTLECRFSPWYQKPPVIEARVFDRQGKMYELSKDDSTVSSAQSDDPQVLTNDQIARAALPGLQDGSIVEERITVEEQASYFPEGNYQVEMLDHFVALEYSSIEIDVPESLPHKIVFLGKEYPIQETRENGRIRKRIELKKIEGISARELEGFLPKGTYPIDQVAICVGGSWGNIAAGYSDIVERQLKDMDFAPLVKEVLTAEVTTPLETMHASFNWIKKNFRYTGISLGQASIVPARPMQLIARRFGDCKDQATLLVGMLRELGIESHVVLVNSASVRYPNESVPGLNAFDHAITMAVIDGKQYWLDCTNLGSAIENVPSYLQGKSVLVAAPSTQSLTQIPLQTSEGNSFVEDKILVLQKDRLLTTVTNETYSGMYAVGIRETAMTTSIEQMEKEINETMKKENVALGFKVLKQDDPWAQDGVFRRSIELAGSPLESIDYSSSRFAVPFNRILSELPQLYLMEPSEGKPTVSRQNPAEVFTPLKRRRTYTFSPVEGWELRVNEGEKKATIGCVSLLRKSSKRDDGSIFVEMEATIEAGILSVEQLKQLYSVAKLLDDPLSEWNAMVVFREKQPTEDMTRPQAIAKAKLQWETEKSGKSLIEYVNLLCQVALIDEARSITQKAVEEHPDDPDIRIAKAIAAFVDSAGRECYPGMVREVAETELLESKKLNPKNLNVYHYLAHLAYRDIDSLKRKTAGDFARCLSIIEECESTAKEITAGMRDIQIASLVSLDRIPDAVAIAEKYRMDRIAITYRCLELAKASRWSEVKQLRDQIEANRELKATVAETVQSHLSARQMYAAAAEFLEAFAYPDESKAQEIAKTLRKKQQTQFDESPNTTPERVAVELLRRLHISGSQWEWWGDIIVNPSSSSPSLEAYSALMLPDIRTAIRTRMLSREQVSGMVQPKLTVEGDDETGYRCLFVQGNLRIPIFVAKQASGYKVVLPGEHAEPLIKQVQKLAKQDKFETAVKWMDWCMDMFPDSEFLVVESGNPAESIWRSTRKKTPELLEQVSKMLTPWGADVTARYEEAKRWIEAETSKSRKTQLQRYMLANLATEDAPQFVDEASKFLEANPAFSVIRLILLARLLEAKRLDEAKRIYDEGKDNFSESNRQYIELKLNQAQGEFASDLEDLQKKASQSNSYVDWNSHLWAAIFADKLDVEIVKQGATVIRPAREPASLHTLACAEARVGLIDEAVADLHSLLVIQGERFKHADWLVVGFIAEQCQLPEAAIRAYSKVEKEKLKSPAVSAYELAQIRIRQLQSK